MRILYLHQHFSTRDGATGTRSYEMARLLLARGHTVTMVCGSYADGKTGLAGPFLRGVRRGKVEGIDVIELELEYANLDTLRRRTMTFLRYASRASALAIAEPYDLLFATSTPLTAAIPGIAGRWLRRKPFVFEVRDLWPELPRAMRVVTNPIVLATLSCLEWAAYHSANRLVGLSPGIVEGIVRRGVPRDRVALVPNGCDLEVFAATAQPWRPPGVAESDFLAVFAGSHGVANGLDAVLDAAVVLKARGRDDIRLMLIGQGKLKAALEDRARRDGLTNVVFHAPVDKRRMAGLLAASDLGLQILANVTAFYYGTSPNKFFDYLSAGIPVLCNYPGWLSDMIGECECGFAVSPGDPVAFANALEAAADDRPATRAKGARALALGRARFGREQLGGQFMDWVTGAVSA